MYNLVTKFVSRGVCDCVIPFRLPQEAEIASLPFVDRVCPHRKVATILDKLPMDVDLLVHCKVRAFELPLLLDFCPLNFSHVCFVLACYLAVFWPFPIRSMVMVHPEQFVHFFYITFFVSREGRRV